MKGRILIVDDALVMRSFLKKIVSQLGYEVVGEASDGKRALELYKQFKPDLVTMDIIMPNLDGIHALKEILAYDPDAKVIMISAIDQRQALMDAIETGAVDYIIKPFEIDRVADAVNKQLHSTTDTET